MKDIFTLLIKWLPMSVSFPFFFFFNFRPSAVSHALLSAIASSSKSVLCPQYVKYLDDELYPLLVP